MKKNAFKLVLSTIVFASTLSTALPSWAQVAGSSTTGDISITETTRIAMGWSVKKTLLGKNIYNDVGQKVGKVEDLIISPDKSVSYVIVAAGGFLGIGRHDVAIPVTQIQDRSGKLVMAGATKDMIKGMPEFTYATDMSRRDDFIAAADKDIAMGKAAVVGLERQAGTAAADVKSKIEVDITALHLDINSAETKLSSLKNSSINHWKDFQADVSAATARLRKSTARATS